MIAALAAAVMLSACAPTVAPAGGSVRAPLLTDDRYVAADGTSLPLSVWPAANGAPTAVILALHGFGDYRKAWEDPAGSWSDAGITTYAYDQRGFGGSPTRGRWPGTDTLVDDARTVAALVRAGLILSAAAVRSRDTFGPLASAGLWFFAHTIPWMPAGPTSIDYMPTDNPQTLDKLRNDPMMLRQPRLDMAYGLVDLMDDARASAARVREPYMMMYGLADRIVPQAPVKAAIEIMPPRADSKLAFYKNGYHLLMRDKAGPAVTADVVVWISDHEAKLPSGADASQSQPEMTSLWGSKRKPPGPR